MRSLPAGFFNKAGVAVDFFKATVSSLIKNCEGRKGIFKGGSFFHLFF